MQKNIAVLLSGCGYLDGTEIHEATLTLLAIHKYGAQFTCFAPNKEQHHVINHLTGEEMADSRNVLVESARIARGNVDDLRHFSADNFDALLLPGGFGAAKNLSDFAFKGADCQIDPEVASAIRAMHEVGKPIGALCIAPALIAQIISDVTVTIGQDRETAEALITMGAHHKATLHGEITVDTANKVVSTPCYMLESRVDQIAEGADKVVQAVLEMT